jgi:gluconate 5-dehydrogenase
MRLEATDEDNWRSVVTSIIDKFGAIDILINNAGGRNPETTKCIDYNDMSRYFLDDRSLVSWTHTLDTNLTSAFLGCKTIVPYMKKQYHGKIVNISSIDGIVGRDLELYRDTGLSPTIPDYLASKAAIISLTRGLAVVLAQHNIHVNCISPGGFYRGQPNEFVRKYCEKVPLKRMGKDETDLKGAIAFLCSSASDYVTGHNLVVDGGWTAW